MHQPITNPNIGFSTAGGIFAEAILGPQYNDHFDSARLSHVCQNHAHLAYSTILS